MALIYDGGGEVIPMQVEYRARHRDGHWLWFETRTSIIHDTKTGKPTGALSVAREITARKTLEAELQQRTREAQAATEAKSDFLANMSHEIRTPLTAILGFSRMLRGLDDMPAEAAQHLQRIATAGAALLSVVNDVLDFSKLDAGQLELDARPFDPAGFARETLDLVAEQAALKGLTLKIDLAEGLPSAVLADSGRLRQILLNLLGNAIKFTQVGGVSVSISHEAVRGGHLRVAVRDTGAGVPLDRRDRLFQRFSQVDGSVSRQHGGSGLGLAICKRLTELMGGEIGVDSVEGEGSTFWFHIQAPPAELDYDDLFEDEEEASMTPRRLLVVDDLSVNRELARAILAPLGHDVIEACGGREAVEAASADTFDLILMDLQMPGMDGLSATRAIRTGGGPNQATPILALSADVLAGQQAASRAAGMNDHIAKPIDVSDLLTKVAYWARCPVETALESQRASAAE
jgi:signal transduction histidine kinase/AmiR/NasT family two-component response regulator